MKRAFKLIAETGRKCPVSVFVSAWLEYIDGAMYLPVALLFAAKKGGRTGFERGL